MLTVTSVSSNIRVDCVERSLLVCQRCQPRIKLPSKSFQENKGVSCPEIAIDVLQVPSKESLPSDEELAKEVVSVLSGVNVLEFNIKMLMKHLSKPPLLPVEISHASARNHVSSHGSARNQLCIYRDAMLDRSKVCMEHRAIHSMNG